VPRALALLVLASITLVASPATRAFAQWVPNGIPVGSTGQIQEQEGALICPDNEGGCFVAWGEQVVNSTTDVDCYLQHVLADGRLDPRWPIRGAAVVVVPNGQDLASIISDGAGGSILFWLDLRTPTMENDLYASRVGSNGQVAQGWTSNGTPVCLGPGGRTPSSVCRDGSGGAYFSWDDYADGTERARVTHVSGDGILVPGWPAGGLLATSYLGASGASTLISEPDGCLIVWADERNRSPLGVNMWALRLTATGQIYPGWNPAGTPLTTIGTTTEIRRAVSDGAGGAFVAWDDNRVGVVPQNPFYYDIYSQHVFADGTRDPRWPVDGLPVCNAPDAQYDFDMGEDGSGGCVFMWEDDRANFFEVYGQRLQADGTVAPGWLANGTPVSSGTTSKFAPRIAPDGIGGFYGVWEDYPSDATVRVGGQHMRGDGTFDPFWTGAGTILASNDPNGRCDEPVIAIDALGGATVAYRRSDSEPWIRTFALRIQADGPVPTLLSFADYDTGPGRVSLRWQASDASAISATVERSPDGAAWTPLGAPRLEGTDLLVYDDLGVSAGRWSYRLSYMENGVQRFSEPVTVEVSAAAQLALGGFRPNPATSSSAIAFSLPDARPARLEVLDVRGRILLTREVGGLGAGTHNVRLSDAGRLGAGVYWVRLVRPETTLTRKGVVAG
jgi:hypothetical protein